MTPFFTDYLMAQFPCIQFSTPEPCHVACKGTNNVTLVTMTIGPLKKYINLNFNKNTQLCTIFTGSIAIL